MVVHYDNSPVLSEKCHLRLRLSEKLFFSTLPNRETQMDTSKFHVTCNALCSALSEAACSEMDGNLLIYWNYFQQQVKCRRLTYIRNTYSHKSCDCQYKNFNSVQKRKIVGVEYRNVKTIPRSIYLSTTMWPGLISRLQCPRQRKIKY
jgi:hypothetical protein